MNTLEPIVPSQPDPSLGIPDGALHVPMVPAPPVAPPTATWAAPMVVAPGVAARSRRWPSVLVALGLLGPLAIVVESAREVPFFAFTPGDAEPSQPRIKVTKATTYDSTGAVLFVTVGVPHLTGLSERFARRNPDDEVVPARAILGDQTPQENREENLKLMGYSKDFATYVALKKLGYDVTLKGGGAAIDSTCLRFATDGKSCTLESPAAAVLEHDDVITAIDGTPIHLSAEIPAALAGKAAGTTVDVTVKRLGQKDPLTVPVTLTTSPDDAKRVIIGFIPNDSPPVDLGFQFPVDVGIDSGQVGGPSAGLAFTLALLDKLSPGELTGGVNVAATGTMSPSGAVGPIGGLKQKTVAVQRAGAKLFLVPESEKDDAIKQAQGSDLKVIGVSTIDEALTALADLGGNAASFVTKAG